MNRRWDAAQFAFAAALAVWFMLTTAGDSARRSATVDEPRHLAGGWTYWRLNDYRIHPENGALTQRWLTLPFFALRPTLPSTDSPEFRRPSALSMRFAADFLHRSGNDPGALLSVARTMNAFLGLGLAVMTAFVARWIWPGASGLLPFALACLCPNLVAHAGVATSDIAAALGFLFATLCWARLLERLTLDRVLWGGVSWGLLAGLKMSAPLIGLTAILAALPKMLIRSSWPWRFGPRFGNVRSRVSTTATLIALLIVHTAVAALMLWSCYGFRYSAFTRFEPGADAFTEPWEQILQGAGVTGAALRAARDWRLLPEGYLFGLAHALKHAQQWPAYLNGRSSPTGWWYYFPLVFLMKTPLPTLGLLLLAAWRYARALAVPVSRREQVQRSKSLRRAWPFAAFALVYFLVACRSNLNIGYRHLLPILPPLFALAGGLEQAKTLLRLAAWLLVAWLAAVNVAARPHYLSYFNELAGGRTNGYRRLADSNVDWGQDLPAFRDWLNRVRAAGDTSPSYLLYFGEDDPKRFGIDLPEPFTDASPGGWYCFSATVLTAPSKPRPLWDQIKEGQYQEMLALRPSMIDADGDLRQRLRRARQLRTIAGLTNRRTDANIGGSILAFKLSQQEVNQLLVDSPPR